MGQRLGQHFLNNSYYAKVLADAVAVRPGETIVEVGPGKGALTKHLLTTGAPVVAIEKDEALAASLPATFPGANLRVITGDIRDFFSHTSYLVPRTYCVAANIPYYITGEIIRSFFEAGHQPRAMALLIQKEVAERIVARDGKESILSLSVKAFGTPKIISKVGKGNFNPPPKVDSAIILIDDISRKNFVSREEERRFFDTVKAGFASKRKLLAGNLSKAFGKAESTAGLTACEISATARAEDLRLEQWLALSKRLSAPA